MDRQLHISHTQGVSHVRLPVKVLCNGAGAPTLGEGDANGAYFSVSRTAAGAFTLKTKDPFVALVGFQASVTAGTQGDWTVSRGQATKNADNTFSVPFTIRLAGVATDLNAGVGAGTGSVDVELVMRNSNVVP